MHISATAVADQSGHARAGALLDRRAELGFQQPVPRHMVHRAAMAEVFVTDAVRDGEDTFLVAAQWPRDHALYYPDDNGYHDPLLFAETIRQALVYLAHQCYGVPLTHRFVGRTMNFEITDPQLLRTGAAPMPVVLEATWVWVDNRPPKRYGMRLDVVLTVGGRPCGRGSLQVVAIDDKRYGLLRRRCTQPLSQIPEQRQPPRAERVAADRVGRLRAKDSVLGSNAGGRSWPLRLDLDHAILFDHPTDHIPLMALLEGFRQLGHLLSHEAGAGQGRAAARRTLTAASVQCRAFAELDEPTSLVVADAALPADPGRAAELSVDAVQCGVPVATVAMRWVDASAAPALRAG